MSPANHLVVFARAPELGRVKRRLAAVIGDVQAWRFYRRTTAEMLRRLSGDRRWRCWLAVTPDRFASAGRFWPARVRRIPQGEGDLGARMMRSMRRLEAGSVVIIGSDIPGIQAAHIADAFARLGRHDVVFGPAADGGYWLVGVRPRSPVPDLFRAVRWSSADALSDTLANLDRRQKVAFLETLDDVDDADSYARWRRG